MDFVLVVRSHDKWHFLSTSDDPRQGIRNKNRLPATGIKIGIRQGFVTSPLIPKEPSACINNRLPAKAPCLVKFLQKALLRHRNRDAFSLMVVL
jgi:hypothetical protein